MGNLIRTVGNGNMLPTVKRSVGILSDGSVVMMVADNNQVGVTGDGGDNTGVPRLHFYHSTNRVTWTLKATVDYSVAHPSAVASFCVDSANNIHVAYRGSSSTNVWYAKLTYNATGPAWTVTPGVQVATGVTGYNSLSLLDIDMLGDSLNSVVIGAYIYNTVAGAQKTAFMAYVRTTAGAWVAHTPEVLINGLWQLGYADDMTVAGDTKTAIAADNVAIFSWYCTRKASNGTDQGDVLALVRVNVSTGARIQRHTIQATAFKGSGGGFRKLWLFNTASNEFSLAGVVNTTPWQNGVYRFTWNRTTNVASSLIPLSTGPSQGVNITRGSNNHQWCGVAYNGGETFFFFANNGGAVVSTARVFTGTGGLRGVSFGSGWHNWDNNYGVTFGAYDATGRFSPPSVAPLEQIWSGATRNWSSSRIDAMMFHHRTSGTPQSFRIESRSLLIPLAPGGVKPAASSTQSTDRPTLLADHKLQMYFHQLPTKMEWQIASDAGFSTNLRTITEADADFIIADGTSSPYNKVVTSGEVVPAIAELSQGTWYIRARTKDLSTNFGPYSSSQSFTVTHPPVGADLYPTGGAVFLYAGVGNVTFSWKFTDPSPYDSQTAYQIVVENAEDFSVILDSGKVTSTAQSAALAIPVGGKDINLRWKLTLWDSDDVAGPSSGYQMFYTTDPPVVAITAPASAAVLTTGIPTVQWTNGIGGTKTQAAYRIYLTQGSFVIYDSNWVNSADTSRVLPVGYLSNDQSYTITVFVKDNLDLVGSASIPVTTDWVEPLGPANTWEVYVSDYAKRGFVYITWTDENMDPDFSSWNVYRRRRGDASWTQIATVSSGSGRYAHRDYFIGSGRTYEYTITQMVNRFGDMIESSPSRVIRVTPDADNYWLIDPLVPSNSIPLYQVTADPFSEEYEQETTHIIGVGRHVEYGDRLGYSGSISSSLRDKFVSGLVRENYALNPAMSLESANGAGPDLWFYTSTGTVGEVSSGYYATQNPSPSGKTPYRIYADGIGNTSTDNIRLESSITGSDFPDRMKVPGTTVVLSAWVAVSSLNSDKRYRLSVAWLDGAGAQMIQIDSPALHPVLDGVGSYVPSSGADASSGNATEVWRRIRFITTVPAGTPPAGATIKIRLMGNGGSVSPGELIMGGMQFEMDQLTDYFDGDQFGGDWSGEPYLSYSYGSGYYTARQQRQALERIKAQKTWVYLRNPFGDLWKVAPGNIAIQRIAGVGKSEFVNVTMPYEEVGF